MDEYEKLERELAEEYEVYVTRFRNLHFLEHELDEYNKVRTPAAEWAPAPAPAPAPASGCGIMAVVTA
jgi:hypothetical protein